MKFDHYRTEPCPFDEVCADGVEVEISCVSIEVIASTLLLEVADAVTFRSFVTYSDGSRQEVTEESAWTASGNGAIDSGGRFTSDDYGLTTVSAGFCELVGSTTITIMARCEDLPRDILLVLDRSGSLLLEAGPGATLAHYQVLGVHAMIDVLKPHDQISIASYAGLRSSAGGMVNFSAEATLDALLSSDRDYLRAACDTTYPRTPCAYPDPDTGPNSRCAKVVGGGLELAKAELASSRARVEAKKIFILTIVGENQYDNPSVELLTDQIKATGAIMAVIGIDIPPALVSTYAAYASCGFYFNSTIQAVPELLTRIPYLICYGGYSYGFSYGGGYDCPPPHGDPWSCTQSFTATCIAEDEVLCSVYRTTTMSSAGTVEWDAEESDSSGMHSNSAKAFINIPAEAYYAIQANLEFDGMNSDHGLYMSVLRGDPITVALPGTSWSLLKVGETEADLSTEFQTPLLLGDKLQVFLSGSLGAGTLNQAQASSNFSVRKINGSVARRSISYVSSTEYLEVPVNTDYLIPFNTTDYNTGGFITAGRITAPTKGNYRIGFTTELVYWYELENSNGSVWLRKNGSETLQRVDVASELKRDFKLNVTAALNAGDFVEVIFRHDNAAGYNGFGVIYLKAYTFLWIEHLTSDSVTRSATATSTVSAQAACALALAAAEALAIAALEC